MTDARFEVPDSLNEEYYQINPDILASFSKYRPPLNIYLFKEDVARIVSYYKVGQRLSNDQIEELSQLVKQGIIFVSREDHPVYVKHISYQLDLVLVDKNLKESEIADIFVHALTMRLTDFMDQPVNLVLQKLYEDILVLTQYLFADIHRVKALVKRLHKEHSLANHSLNTGIVGLALYGWINSKAFAQKQIKRKKFDRLAMGLFIHDMGMTKIPAFIRHKTKPLTADERTKILRHTQAGFDMMTKMDMKSPEVEAAISEHHERLDGSGYPQKKSGREISGTGRLAAVADSFCAMISKRVYAEAMDPVKAVTLLARDQGYDSELTKNLQAMILTQSKK